MSRDILGLHTDFATVGHRIARIDDQVEHGRIELRRICLAGPERLLQLQGNADPCIRRMPHERFERSEEHTSELQSLMRISSAVVCLNKKNKHTYKSPK